MIRALFSSDHQFKAAKMPNRACIKFKSIHENRSVLVEDEHDVVGGGGMDLGALRVDQARVRDPHVLQVLGLARFSSIRASITISR